MKKLLFVLSFSLIGLAACGSTDTVQNTEDNSKQTEEVIQLVAGTAAEFPPFEYLDKGEIVGFDADLIAAIAEEAGIEIEMKNIGWETLFPSINNGDIDLAASGVTITEDRQASYDFSMPYFESTHMIVFKEGLDIKDANDIVGKKIGVQINSTGQEAVEKVVGKNDPSISKYDNMGVAFMALQNGDVEVVVTDNFVIDEYLKNNQNSGFTAIEDTENFAPEYYGYAFAKDDEIFERFNEALKTVIENGTYEQIFQKWFPVIEPNVDVLLEQAQ